MPLSEPILTIKNISKSFEVNAKGSLPVLKDLNFVLNKGEILAIVGPSGCGKTTLLNIIAQLLPASAGEIIFTSSQEKQKFGYLFQRDALFPWKTVSEQIEFPLVVQRQEKNIIQEQVAKWIKLVGLEGFEQYYPSQISQGMKKRVALAMTFISEPRVVLMDEPFAALDVQTRDILEQELLALWQEMNTSLIWVTHDLREALSLADQVLVFSARPGTVKAEFPVPLPRPRNLWKIQTTNLFIELYEKIWAVLSKEVMTNKTQ